MPTVEANGIDIYYETQGEGEPLVLIPYLAADQACYAFQVAEYAKHFTCFSVDLRGAGLSGKPEGHYTTELFADDLAAFMQAAGVDRAHVAGLSLGAATGMWLAAKHPERVASLSLHSAWDSSDAFLRVVAEHRLRLAEERIDGRHRTAADEVGERVDVLGSRGVQPRGEAPGEDPLDHHVRDAAECLRHDPPALDHDAEEGVGAVPGAVQRQGGDPLRVLGGEPHAGSGAQ